MYPSVRQSLHSFLSFVTLIAMIATLIFPVTSFLPSAHAQEVTEEPVVEITATEAPLVEEPAEAPTEATAATEPPSVEEPTEEATEAPADVPTEEATEAPVDVPTEEVAETPAPEVTDEPDTPVDEGTGDVVPEVTEEPALEPEVTPEPDDGIIEDTTPADETGEEIVEEPTAVDFDSFSDDFANGIGDHWMVAGWELATDESGNQYLNATVGNATATLLNIDWADLQLTANLYVDTGNTASISIRTGIESYRVMLDTDGNSRLYRGETLLTASAVAEDTGDAEAAWHSVSVQAQGDTILVTVDGVESMAFTDVEALTIGNIVFSTGSTNEGSAAVDDIQITRLDTASEEVVVENTPTPEPTTVEEIIEGTEEPVAEETTAEDVVVEEAATGLVILSEDFEGELTQWQTDANVVAVDETNQALLMVDGSTLIPVDASELTDQRIDGLANILTDGSEEVPGGISLSFYTSDSQSYTANISSTGTTLVRNDVDGTTLLAESATVHDLNSWHTFSLTTQGNVISISVNDIAEITFTEETTFVAGSFAFAAQGSVMVDNLVVTDLTQSAVPEVTPTPAPLVLTEAHEAKLPGSFMMVASTYMDTGVDAAQEWIVAYNMQTDEDGRVLVSVRAAAAQTGNDLVALIEAAGGVIVEVDDHAVEAYLPIEGIIALATAEEISSLREPSKATSTGPTNGPVGANESEGFDLIGAQDWHLAALDADGVLVGVVDTGFLGINGVSTSAGQDYQCLQKKAGTFVYSGVIGTTDHGLNVIEIICDIAPDSTIRAYQADDYDSLDAAVAQARTDGVDVLAITLDLGVDVSSGDGTGHGGANDPYDEIADARNDGMIIIAAAGNNEGRYATFSIDGATGGAVSMTIEASAGDHVKVGWNDWDGSLNGGTLEDFSVNITVNSQGASRGSAADPPGVDLTVPNAGACSIANSPCTLPVTITRASGNSGTVHVQVQVIPVELSGETQDLGVGFTALPSGGGSTDLTATTGNIGRPADSPDVTAVGAVCANFQANFNILANSSNGPIFGPNGTAPIVAAPYTRNEVKPDLVSVSHVSTSNVSLGDPFACDGTTSGSETAGGFGGTSAAAAHVAGQAAILRSSNIGAVNSSLNPFLASSGSAVTALEDYLQTHSADLPLGSGADGFDQIYGAGLTVLGSPEFNLNNVENPTAAANNFETGECTGDIYYVGLANPGAGTLDGTITNPFVHPGEALAQATAGACVILLPGEYVTPLYINGINDNLGLMAYDDVTSMDNNASAFWINAMYFDDVNFTGSAGIFVDNGTSGEIISGFNFLPGKIFDTTASFIEEPQAIIVYDTEDVTIRNGSFGEVTIDGTLFDGWDFNDATPISILADSDGARVENNSFDNNTSQGGSIPSVRVLNSGTTAKRVTIIGNDIRNSTNRLGGTTTDWASILYAEDSNIDIINNAFVNNSGETIVRTKTSNDDTGDAAAGGRETRILGNVFLRNTTGTDEGSSNSGAMINAHLVPRFYFINNTVIENDMTASTNFGALIARGDGNILTTVGSIIDSNKQRWEIHNNLFDDNILPAGLVDDPPMTSQLFDVKCDRLGGPVDGNNALQYNWYQDANGILDITDGGKVCGSALQGGTGTLAGIDPATQYIGTAPGISLDPATDPDYYALKQISAAPDVFSDGIDAANPTFTDISGGLIDGADFDRDRLGQGRNIDVLNWEEGDATDTGTLTTDIGAYEFSPIQIANDPLIPAAFIEDINVPFEIDLGSNVTGGFGGLTFTIDTIPNNFGTYCGVEFTGTSGLVIGTGGASESIFYCPPLHFYTDNGGTDPDWPDFISFNYTVEDTAGANASGEVRITINPDNSDLALTGAVGDASPDAEDIFAIAANLGTSRTVTLRPFVSFNNFFFSEASNSEFTTGGFQLEYPFTYNITNVSDPLSILNPPVSTGAVAGGELTVTIDPNLTNLGQATITYTVTDKDGANSTTNTLIVTAVSNIPEKGIHDDSSFVFNYSDGTTAGFYDSPPTHPGPPNPGSWVPASSLSNINNTLHTTTGLNDTATFRFIGTGAVLYMQGSTRGGLWDLEVDGETLDGWTAFSTNVFTSTIAAIPTATCSTQATVSGINISNFGRDPYTVTCNGLGGGEHTFKIINRQNLKTLSIDAASILEEGSTIFEPGMHDIDEKDLRDLFTTGGAGTWTEFTNTRASNDITMVSQTVAPADEVVFLFTGGTGFAIGTTLDNTLTTYDICVDEVVLGVPAGNSTCQSYNNSPTGTTTRLTYNVFRSWWGFDQAKVYQVTLTNIVGTFTFDSFVVLPENYTPTSALPFGITEDDQVHLFAFGNGVDDSWLHDMNKRLASNLSLTSMNRTTIDAGPFIGFNIDASADTLYWYSSYDRRGSTDLLICVDRALAAGADGDHGNCIIVDQQAAVDETQFQVVGTDGTLTDGVGVIQPIEGVLVIQESMFRGGTWGPGAGGLHTIEVSSLVDLGFNLDKVGALNSANPLPAGYYEEFTTTVEFYDDTFVQQFPTLTASTRTTDYTPDTFYHVVNRGAIRDSGKGIVYTSTVGASVYAEIDGTGFAPRFRQDRESDAVNICWMPLSDMDNNPVPDAQEVLEEGLCWAFDNQNTRPTNLADLTIPGLADDTYGVVIQMLDDNFDPAAHTKFPLNMWFDGITVFDDDWASLNQLVPGTVYEANFNNREVDNNFIYNGTLWKTTEGTRARTASNQDHDTTIREIGASVVFRTNNGNAIEFTRAIRRGYSPVKVCAAPEATPTDRICTIVENDGTSRTPAPVIIYLNDTGSTAPHVVSMVVLEAGTFDFDAIEVLDTSAPLTAGKYDQNEPGIVYDAKHIQYVPNGDMETDNGTTIYWDAEGTLTTNERSTTRYTGRYSRHILTGAASSGIKSQSFDIENGEYTVVGRVYIPLAFAGNITMRVVRVSDSAILDSIALDASVVENQKVWQTLRINYAHVGGTEEVELQFIADNAGSDFHVDDAHFSSGGKWLELFRTTYFGGSINASQTHGATMTYSFTGTGTGIGIHVGRDGGEMEVCYDDNAGFSSPECIVFQNESIRPNTTTLRSITGLTPGTYYVRVRDVEDGVSVTGPKANTARLFRYAVGKLLIDCIYVFDDPAPTQIPAGVYNEDHLEGGNPALQLLPDDLWANFTGRFARNKSDDSYSVVVDKNGRASRNNPGGTGLLTLDLSANNEAVVILDTGIADRTASPLLACVDGYDGSIVWNAVDKIFEVVDTNGVQNCFISYDMVNSSQVVFNSNNLPLLGTGGADRVLTFQSLATGTFDIDDYLILYDTTLTEGYYEEVIGFGDVGSGSILELSPSDWTLDDDRLASGASKLETAVNGATFQYTFTGTGTSILSRFHTRGGSIDITINDSGGCGGAFCLTENGVSTNGPTSSSAITYAGLPFSTYDVTITTVIDVGLLQTVNIDAIEVYGTLQALGSIYDDAQTDVNGTMLLTFGPNNKSWDVFTGTRARNYLNETYHKTDDFGATLSFEVGAVNPVTGIVVFYGTRSTSSIVEVCWVDTGTLVRTCTDHDFSDRVGRQTINAPVAGNYFVSITNKVGRKSLELDAIQVLEAGVLAEGIYDVAFLNQVSVDAFNTGTWTINETNSTAAGANGAALEFEMTGIAFSIKLKESAAASDTYTLCIDGDGSLPCTNDVGINPSPNLVRDPLSTGDFAITFAGLHNGTGDGDYAVSLTNTDATSNLTVTGVHVMGANTSLKITDTTAVENTDPKLRYLPFGSLLDVVSKRTGPSEFSQHVGALLGSIAYFEFDDIGAGSTGFEFVRELSTIYGNNEICFGRIGTDTSGNGATCETIDNRVGRVFQRSHAVTTPSAGYCGANGCWVSIENTTPRKRMTVDLVRLFDTTQPLTAGKYPENHPGLTYTPVGGTWVDLAVRLADGGFVKFIEDDIGASMYFLMDGTGFTVDFTLDRKSDEIDLCWLEYSGAPPAAVTVVATGTCQSFDNQSTRTTYTAGRSIQGLHKGTYAVVAVLQADNGDPKAHTAASELPIGMQIDGVKIYDDAWFDNSDWSDATDLNALEPGTRYEGSFDNQDIDKNFLYYGNWTSTSGRAASRYSNSDYDRVREVGATIVLRTDNANALTLIRGLRKGYSRLLVCSTPVVNTPPLEVDYNNRFCQIVSNDGSGFQQQIGLGFGSTNTGPHVITLTTLDSADFYFDAIELFDVTGALTAGTYSDVHPAIFYNNSYTNHIVNGDMEIDGNWTDIPGSVPSTNEQSAIRYENRKSRHVVGNVDQGIQSDIFALGDNQMYTVVARVNAKSGTVRMRLVQDGNTNSIAEFTEQVTDGVLFNKWITLRADFFLPTGISYNDLRVQFIADGGSSEFYVDDVTMNEGGSWETQYSPRNFGGSATISQTHGASMQFTITGTGTEIGIVTGRDGGETQLCYDDDANLNPDGGDGTPPKCLIHQTEVTRASKLVSITIAGLQPGTYTFQIKDLEDGDTVTAKTMLPRIARYGLNKIGIQYVRVFDLDPSTMPVAAPGYYNEDAANSGNFLEFLPEDRWLNFSGSRVRGFSENSYTTVVDDRGRASSLYAGPTMLMNVEVPVGVGNMTVVLYTGAGSRRNTSQVLICAVDSVAGGPINGIGGEVSYNGTDYSLINTQDCTLRTDMDVDAQITVDANDIPALAVEGTHTLMFTSLTPGNFHVDAFQIIAGSDLAQGIFDDFMPDTLLNFEPNLNLDDKACDITSEWCRKKSRNSYGGVSAATHSLNATLTAGIEGTGFSVVTKVGRTGTDMRICYKLTSSAQPFPDLGSEEPHGTVDLTLGDIWCDNITTDTDDFAALLPGRPKPTRGDQYGFSYYGLPFGKYTLEVRMTDAGASANELLYVDAIVVFGDPADAGIIGAGFYDDENSLIQYEASPFWTTTVARLNPPRGPFNLTEHTATNAGSVVQMYVDSNAFILYQTVDTRNTKHAAICLVVTGDVIHCTPEAEGDAAAVQVAEFSQNSRRTYFTPILFYGLGDGTHRVIIENRDHTRKLSVDAVQVMP